MKSCSCGDSLMPKYAQLAYNGFWYAPEMEALQTFIDETQKYVTGTVRMKLYKGNCIIAGRKSPYSLYSEDFATFEKDEVYNQMDATGFIRLNALRLRIKALKKDEWAGGTAKTKAKAKAKAAPAKTGKGRSKK